METTPNPRADAENDESPLVEQPGLSRLREAAANALHVQLPGRAALILDALAGLNSALGSTPDGMANGILAGVSPVFGLYASIIGPVVGSIFSSTQLMVINSTSATALAANQPLSGLAGGERERALFTLVILAGIFQLLLGLLHAGRLVRFVSYSVMTGFLTGVAALMVLSQFSTVTGVEGAGATKLAQAIDVLRNLGDLDPFTFVVALLTLLLIFLLPRLRVGSLAPLIAIAAPSALVALLHWDSVRVVQDVSAIPSGLPALYLPSLADLTPSLASGALAVAVISFVQGAGVSQSVPNPDGKPRRTSRDVLAQGAANLASGFFRGMPVGGSLSATALSVIAGPRSRWSAIFNGLWIAAFVLFLPGLIGFVAMPALGALLIHAGLNTIKPADWRLILRTGWPSILACVVTFLATLLLSIEAAVGLGVLLSALLYMSEAATDISVVELVKRRDGRIEEHRLPGRLQSNQITVLDVYGPIFYASAPTLGRLLPSPEGAQNPVVVLRLRGHTTIGATLVDVLSGYVRKLKEANGRLYLTGISKTAYEQLKRMGKVRLDGPVRVYEATPVQMESTHQAVTDAQQWLVSLNDDAGPSEDPSGGPDQDHPDGSGRDGGAA